MFLLCSGIFYFTLILSYNVLKFLLPEILILSLKILVATLISNLEKASNYVLNIAVLKKLQLQTTLANKSFVNLFYVINFIHYF